MNKIMILLMVFLLVKIVPSFAYESEIYEKEGCVYIVGHWTIKEKANQNRIYAERETIRNKQVGIEAQQRHEIKIEIIKAQAMRDYLIAQTTPLREIANAIRGIKIRQNVNIGDVKNFSSVGNVTSSSNSEGGAVSNTNSVTGGSATSNSTSY